MSLLSFPSKMPTAVYVMGGLTLLMVAGAVPIAGGGQTAIFRTPAFVLLMGALCISLTACSIKRRISLRNVGFYLTHMGTVLALVGALIGFIWEVKSNFMAPVGTIHRIAEVPLTEHDYTKLPFSFAATRLEIEHYDPDYALYKPEESVDESGSKSDFTFVRRISVPAEGTLDLGEAGAVDVKSFRDQEGGWVAQVPLDSGWLLQMYPPTDKTQNLTMQFHEKNGETTTAHVKVNHPSEFQGWMFYLMSYDRQGQRHVTLMARRDPGRLLAIWGMVALMAGVVVMGFARRGGDSE